MGQQSGLFLTRGEGAAQLDGLLVSENPDTTLIQTWSPALPQPLHLKGMHACEGALSVPWHFVMPEGLQTCDGSFLSLLLTACR